MTHVYLFCLTLGFVFTVVGALLGSFLGGAAGHAEGADAAGHDGPEFTHSHEAGVEGGGVGEGDVANTPGGPLAWPILSPTVISFFVAGFGGTGLLYQKLLGDLAVVHVPLAILSAAAMGLALAAGIYKFTSTFETSRMARVGDALGALAEVTVSVPKVGMGEVAYLAGGTRQLASARTLDGREYPTGTPVRILRMTDGIAYVGEAPPPSTRVTDPNEPEPPRGEPVRNRQRS